jgi:hypothetical protein
MRAGASREPKDRVTQKTRFPREIAVLPGTSVGIT